MEIITKAKFIRIAPDKIRILVKMIKSKNPHWAITQLEFTQKNAAKPLILVIKQGLDQIKTKGLVDDDFKIKNILINEGPKLKRRRIRHQGRATAILKRMSHLTIILSDDEKSKIKPEIKQEKAKSAKKDNKKATKGSK